MMRLSLLESAGPLRVLALGAHADDLEIGCGGLVLQLLRRDAAVHVDWCVLSATPERAAEARLAAAALLDAAATARVTVEHFTDGHFPYEGAAIKAWFEALKHRPRPDLILTHSVADRHQDHRTVADLTWNTFRDHLILEYEIPKYDGDLRTPNLYAPIDEATLERKIEILLDSFASQRARPWFEGETFRALARLRGLECASPTRFAEGFHARKVVLA
jgi:LmbE family N-acetylglucosaminyl deacetylase